MAWQKPQTITPRDYFYLASHKFPQRGSFLENWEVANTETYYRHGLIAISFVNSSMKQVVIAFQLLDNVTVSQESLNYARDFVKHAKQLAQRLDYQISYTGKYRGGTVAELCAMQDKLPCYTFDSESIETNLK